MSKLKHELKESKTSVDRFIAELMEHPDKAKRIAEILASIVKEK